MRSVRIRILATLLVLAGVGVGGWQLLPAQENSGKTITVGTTDAVTSLDPAGAYDAGSWALFSNVFQSLLTFEPGGAAPCRTRRRAAASWALACVPIAVRYGTTSRFRVGAR